MIQPIEVVRGLVMRLDPLRLLDHGAHPDRPRERAVQGPHYFVCIGRTGPYSVWVPAFSRPLPGRVELRNKSGSRDWMSGSSYIDLAQMWVVPDAALPHASVGLDHSVRGLRNRTSCQFLSGATEAALAS